MLKQTYQFLTNLKDNNNREWFEENKEQYQTAKESFENLTETLIADIQSFDPEIGALSPKDCTFRIFRDVRFSQDKSPYKTNMGAFIVKGGKKSGNAGYYFHLEPDSIFVGGGLHMPPADTLHKVRTDIMENVDEFKEILNDKEFKHHFSTIDGDKLKNPPKGFPKDFEEINLLKFKSYTVGRKLSDNLVSSPDLIAEIGSSFRAMYTFIRFLNYSLD